MFGKETGKKNKKLKNNNVIVERQTKAAFIDYWFACLVK